MTTATKTKLCGHEADGNGFDYKCDLPEGHKGLHAERVKLRGAGQTEYTQTTNWGDDGLAPHATRGRSFDNGRTWVKA